MSKTEPPRWLIKKKYLNEHSLIPKYYYNTEHHIIAFDFLTHYISLPCTLLKILTFFAVFTLCCKCITVFLFMSKIQVISNQIYQLYTTCKKKMLQFFAFCNPFAINFVSKTCREFGRKYWNYKFLVYIRVMKKKIKFGNIC